MPKSINRVFLLGNLGQNPEVKHTQAGTPVARLSLATNERFKNKKGEWEDRTEWHNVILWARLAEIAGEYLKKGSKIHIEGVLKTHKWEKDAVIHYRTDVVATDLIMLDGKPLDDKKPAANDGPITDEDIPF